MHMHHSVCALPTSLPGAQGPTCCIHWYVTIMPTAAASAPAQVQVIKFVRESLETQIVTDEGRQQLMMFTDHFSQWPEDKRVEEYAMMHFSWSVGREDKQHAVLQRVEKVLAV